ncbi:hypothetical protein ACVMB3_007063 [Sinorhizobium meliloti]
MMEWTPPRRHRCARMVVFDSDRRERPQMEVNTIGLDLAKNVFQADGAVAVGAIVSASNLLFSLGGASAEPVSGDRGYTRSPEPASSPRGSDRARGWCCPANPPAAEDEPSPARSPTKDCCRLVRGSARRDGAVHRHDLAAFQPFLPGAGQQHFVDRFPGIRPDRADRLVQDRLFSGSIPMAAGQDPMRRVDGDLRSGKVRLQS